MLGLTIKRFFVLLIQWLGPSEEIHCW